MLGMIINFLKGLSRHNTELSELDNFLHTYRKEHPQSASAQREYQSSLKISELRDATQ